MIRNEIETLSLPATEVVRKMDQQRTSDTGSQTDTFKAKSETPALFKLNFDCIAHILDYLSLVDLANVAQTCKLLHKVAGNVFQLHYPFANVTINDDGIFLENHDRLNQHINVFSEYFQCATFSDVMADDSAQVHWHHFKSIKHVNFYFTRFNTKNCKLVKEILQNAEIVELSDCYFHSGDMYKDFLEHCKNLKELIITINYDYDANWLYQEYPRLEYLSIVPIVYIRREIYDLAIFFKRNPTVRKFFTSSKFLLDNKSVIMQAKFNDLKISVDDLPFDAFCKLLNELHAMGVYKRIHITFFECFEIDQQFIDQLSSIKALVGLKIPAKIVDIDLNTLVNLEILRFDCNVNHINNMTNLAQNLTNLREISFVKADIDDVILFVYDLPKLRKIVVEKLIGFHRDIDLFAVNRRRKMLFEIAIHVSKVFVYVPEATYLSIRNKFITMNLELVEILRYELYDNTRF